MDASFRVLFRFRLVYKTGLSAEAAPQSFFAPSLLRFRSAQIGRRRGASFIPCRPRLPNQSQRGIRAALPTTRSTCRAGSATERSDHMGASVSLVRAGTARARPLLLSTLTQTGTDHSAPCHIGASPRVRVQRTKSLATKACPLKVVTCMTKSATPLPSTSPAAYQTPF